MSDILSKIDPKMKQTYLMGVIKKILPDSGTDISEISIEENERTEALLNEIKSRLRIKPSDDPLSSRYKLYKYLTEEISNYTLKPIPLLDIKQRVGQKGMLPPSLYSLEFSQQFNEVHLKHGVPPNYVRDTVAQPYGVQHLFPRPDMSENVDAISLYTRDFSVPRSEDIYTLFVRTMRKGYIQHVYAAWLVFHSDVQFHHKEEPLDILAAFVDVYGMPFQIGQLTSKFIVYDVVQGSGLKITLINPDKHKVLFDANIRSSSPGKTEIAITYCIDTTKYENSLRKHGITKKK